MISRVQLEVAVATLGDAQTAHAGGADRLELNAALELGGLTPSLGTLIAVKRAVPLPVVAMIRPRPGGFVYADSEFLTMRRDADLALAHGADGLVFGFLRADRTIDLGRTGALVRQAGGRETVFHRAFDLTGDPMGALEQLIDLGVTRVLTSGQEATAPAGAELIRRLIERAAGRIEILPGSGITPENGPGLVRAVGAGQLHGSFSDVADDPAGVVCGGEHRVTSARKLREIRAALQRLTSGGT